MKEEQNKSKNSFFSIGLGILVIAVGLAWLLQSFGLIPANLDLLRYAFPVCVILIGTSILLKRNTN
jgi:hypothetical protein